MALNFELQRVTCNNGDRAMLNSETTVQECDATAA